MNQRRNAGLSNKVATGGNSEGQSKRSDQDRSSREERLQKVIDSVVDLVENGFTGSLRINFSQGSIGRVEKFEEILKTKKK